MMPSLLNQPATAGRRDRDESARPKSVLFCQSCGHESPLGGDWRVARVDRRTRREKVIYTCPECARTVVTRPDSGHEESGSGGEERERPRQSRQ
jgi:predicted RNA-binding Zn-ribbon protein involved in translation (DUF1610 family)